MAQHGPHHVAVVVVVAGRSAPSAAGHGKVIRVTSPVAELRLAREKNSKEKPNGAESR